MPQPFNVLNAILGDERAEYSAVGEIADGFVRIL
jgi:hypothetical protein